MNVLDKGFNELEASVLILLRGSRRALGEEEQNETFEEASDLVTTAINQVAECDDNRAVVLWILKEVPGLVEPAILRAKELDLDLADLWDILSTDNLSPEDQRDFEEMFRKKSNTAEVVAQLEDLTGIDSTEIRSALAGLLKNPVQTLTQVAQIAVKSPVQSVALILLNQFFGKSK